MGFGKKADEAEERPRKKTGEEKKFVPTTKEQWKAINKRARKREESREKEKSQKREKEKSRKRFVKDVDTVRKQLAGTDDLTIRMFRDAFFEAIIKAVKENGGTPPAYHAFEELREVRDARFRFDLHLALARMSWMQHTRLIEVAVGQSVPTRDWTEAWHAVCRLAKHFLNIKIDKAGNERIKDREALDDWPIPERKRAVKLSDEEKVHKRDVPTRLERAKKMRKKKGKEDHMTLDMFEEDEKRRLKAARDKDDDEDERDDDEEEDKEDEEDEDEEEEKGKKSKKSKKNKKSEKSSDEEDDDEDEKDDDGDDEEDDEEDGDDEDDEPKRKKEKRKVSSKKSSKSDKKSKKSEKPEKKEKSEASSGSDTFKVAKKFKGGIKEEVQSLISAKGSTLEQVVAAAKKSKLDKSKDKIRAYLNWMAANGYLKRV